MFDPKALANLYGRHEAALGDLVVLEGRLNARFFRMEKAVHALMLAAMTGEALVMIGPPGTAKSRLIRSFCNLTGLLEDSAVSAGSDDSEKDQRSERYFEYLLTQFTEPSELFGFFDLGRLFAADASQRAFVRSTKGMMQKAEVVFLDKVFNASSAILNALLTFMNERKFHDRGEIFRTPLRLLVSATNHTPREEGLGAVYDRFLLRARLAETEVEDLGGLITKGWNETHADHGARAGGLVKEDLMARLRGYQLDVDRMTGTGELAFVEDAALMGRLKDMVLTLRKTELSRMSNRRLVKFVGIIQAETLLRHARSGANGALLIEPADLQVILDFGLDADDPGTVAKLREHLTGR